MRRKLVINQGTVLRQDENGKAYNQSVVVYTYRGTVYDHPSYLFTKSVLHVKQIQDQNRKIIGQKKAIKRLEEKNQYLLKILNNLNLTEEQEKQMRLLMRHGGVASQ